MSGTISYYDEHAEAFSEDTGNVDFSPVQEIFLSYVKPGGRILDFGCGAGRDSEAFLKKGYQVDAIDGSKELCRIAGERTGLPVRQMLFFEFSAEDTYDGIFACASLLHVKKAELPNLFHHLEKALKADGALYASFKYGTFEGERDGRYFTDLVEGEFTAILATCPTLILKKLWITDDVRQDRQQKWLNAIAVKREDVSHS